jgi:hypothetical protein
MKKIMLSLWMIFLSSAVLNAQTSRMNLQLKDIPTTQQQSFSSSFTALNYDGFEVLKKQSDKVRVLIIGSSNSQGAGASTYSKSWVGRLQTYLQTKGVLTRNVSIGGTTTSTTLSRLYQDVLTWNPTFVVEATALANEGLYIGNYTSINTALDNLGFIENLCKQQGITFLKGPVLPANSAIELNKKFSLACYYTNTLDKYNLAETNVITTNKQIEPVVSFGDGVHVNDLGHLHIFNSLNPYIITHSYLNNRLPSVPLQTDGVMVQDTVTNRNSSNGFDCTLSSDFPLKSFSVAFQIKWLPNYTNKTLVSLFTNNLFELKHSTNTLVVVKSTGESLSAPVSLPDNVFVDVILTYNSLKGVVSLWVNGKKQVSYAGEVLPDITTLRLCSSFLNTNTQALGHTIRNVFLYRTELPDYLCRNFYNEPIKQRSLVLYTPMYDKPENGSRFVTLFYTKL